VVTCCGHLEVPLGGIAAPVYGNHLARAARWPAHARVEPVTTASGPLAEEGLGRLAQRLGPSVVSRRRVFMTMGVNARPDVDDHTVTKTYTV
jgi:hypothetical protein